MYVSEIDVKLKMPITVGIDGVGTEIGTIKILGPSSRHSRQAAALKAMFSVPWRAMIEKIQKENPTEVDKAREEKKEKKEEGKKKDESPRDFLTPQEVLDAISQYTDDNVKSRDALFVAVEYLKDMLITGCAEVSGKDMTKTMFDKLSYADVENILGEYVATFLLDSLFA